MNPRFATLLFSFAAASVHAGEPPASLSKPLEPLRPFIGKTWKGEFKSSMPEKPRFDISKWERALNGKAVRILHSVNNGEYGGETLIAWNAKTERLESHYFTTAGFSTHGTVSVEGSKLITHEHLAGSSGGITEVKGTTELLKDGRMRMTSKFLKNGEWVDGHEILYIEAPHAEVVFK